MILIPAIDILEGQCVRLKEGKFSEKTVYFDDPILAAKHWKSLGAKRLHIVDLDGARTKKPVNLDLVAQIVSAMGDIPVQVGGGIRDHMALESYINVGVHACILGTAVVSNRDFFREACLAYPGKIIAGLDARGETVAVEGWEQEGGDNLFDCAKWVHSAGAEAIIYTDIARDGMLSGVNLGQLERLARYCPIPVIASGGVANLEDIDQLLESSAPIFGVISGRALYQGTLDFQAAQMRIDRAQKTL